MEQEALTLLQEIQHSQDITLYDLASSEAGRVRRNIEEVFEEVTKLVYLLASRGLVTLQFLKGEDGLETHVKASSTASSFLRIVDATR